MSARAAEQDVREKMKIFEKCVHEFADHTRMGIQTFISEARAAEGSSLSRPTQERDRPVFDPRDYKLDVILSQMSLGVWKKWRHEVEIYVDTIGPLCVTSNLSSSKPATQRFHFCPQSRA